ncbi:PPIL4 family peptidylprolyl isomerase [Lachancea thermotolerans CBS 6340]|uniref:Peptidyl-prolyl cis-trans isomerase n=1 Tax=Lachancea thermotolerans (strain ATCC 56472 / CBS 6340 / NRRL Y-8284) TaxID=559295 RepID=C5DK96_LACTC|nr:KLTH0F02838p [Lachancea thermotolerans CBS 6340]CAR23897.1 KLTH0F02838p [Lachancea thermotolerans CBS 6340]
MSVLLETTEGDLAVDLDFDKCPVESFNFLKLCKSGFFDYQCFYNLNKDYSVECGDALLGNEYRGSLRIHSTSIQGLCGNKEPSAELLKSSQAYSKSTLAHLGDIAFLVSLLENSTPVIGSRFMISLAEDDTIYENIVRFGRVADEYLQALRKMFIKVTDDQKRPNVDIRIKKAYILHDPFPDPECFRCFQIEMPIKTVRLPPHLTNRPNQESGLDEQKKIEREMRSKELTLEILGDIPYVGIKPSERVLFVCRLNPITRAKDLATIFHRFGEIDVIEIVRDKETGSSLGYGFIEFTKKESCEMAYSKMDGVLIDDRRIHVDFCQSARKLR